MANLISVRSSSVAVVKKLLEGDLVEPTKSEEFLAIQDDLSFSPNFETVENPEIKDDIMPAQQAISGQSPSVTLSHLFKGGGLAGMAPSYGTLLEATFGGVRSEDTAVNLVAGSTAALLKMGGRDAAKFAKGDTVMVQYDDGTKQLSAVTGTDGTDVSLAFALTKAPAANDTVRPFTTFFPKSVDFPVFDMWHYLGGGEGGLETMVNSRTVSMAISANAKENINCTYTLEGTAYEFNSDTYFRLDITSTTNTLNMQTKVASEAATNAALTLEAGTYTPSTLAAEVQKQLRASGAAANDITVTCDGDSDYKLTFSFSGVTGKVDTVGYRRTGSTAGTLLGFDTNIAIGTAGEEVAAPNRAAFSFVSKVEPKFEQTAPVIARDQRLYLGKTSGENACLNAPSLSFSINTPKTLLTSVCEPSGNFATVINERTASMTVTTFLEENDKRFFDTFNENEKISFLFVGGAKSEGEFRDGETFGIYGSEASITSFSISSVDDVYALEMEVTCYSPGDGSGSIFCTFV